MRGGNRVLLTLFAILSAIAAVLCGYVACLAIFSSGLLSELAGNLTFTGNGMAIVLAVFAVVLLVISVRFLFYHQERKEPQSNSVLLKTSEIGMTRVSITALDALVHRAVKGFNVVRECQSTIINNDDNVSIRLRITLMPDVVMPDITQRLQQEVQEYVQSHSGISVRDVMIYVDSPSPNQTHARVE